MGKESGKSRPTKAGPDPVRSPHMRAELDAIRAQRSELRRSNAGVKENFETCIQAGDHS